MFTWRKPVLLGAILALLVLALNVVVAQAHERRDVGDYQLRTGWLNEPSFEGVQNAVFLAVTALTQNNAPVEGLQESLQVEVTHVPSGTSRTFALEARFGMPGQYVAPLFPTAPGHYQFRFFGAIGGVQINETFNSRAGGGGFDDIVAQTEHQFPSQVASPGQIEGAARGAQTAATAAQATASDADDKASTAQLLAIVGVAVGAIGLILGGGGLWMASRRK